MNEKTLRALVEAGAIKRVRIIGNGGCFHIQADTINGAVTASTLRGAVKTWRTLDGAAKWLHSLGLGKAHLDFAQWIPGQKVMKLTPRTR